MPRAIATLNLCHSETWWTVIPLSNSLQESLFSVVKIAYFKKCSKTHDIITIQCACHAQTVVEVGILVPKTLGWRRNDGLWGRESAVGPDSINIISRAKVMIIFPGRVFLGSRSVVHRPALLILTLFQSNIYKVNVREYPRGFMSSKWRPSQLYDGLTWSTYPC